MKSSVNNKFLILVTTLLFIPFVVKAEEIEANNTITNQNNVVISLEDYNNMLKMHPESYIMTLTQEEYNKLKTLNYDNVKSDTVYIETAYNSNLNVVTSKEITKEEYDSAGEISAYSGSNGFDTQYKQYTLSTTDGSTYTYASSTCRWKIIPSTRSFDVNAMRTQNYTILNGTQSGKQIYKKSGASSYTIINYAANGTNIKRASNGFGISMNLVNDNITSLESIISADFEKGSGTKAIYGTYQHAIQDVSLATSKSYTISNNGLGNVLNYSYENSLKYDASPGVYVAG